MKQLFLSEKALIELVKISIGTSLEWPDFGCLSDNDWQDIFDEAKAQSVALMSFDATKKYPGTIPEQVYNSWFNCSVSSIINNTKILNAQKQMHELFSKNNIKYVVLKGSASSYYYPDYSNRVLGDIDFLVALEDFPKTKEILVANGYEMDLEDHDLHTVFKKDNVTLELHKKPAGMPEGEPGLLAEEFMKNILCEAITEEDPAFVRPTDKIHALVILFHTIYHMFAGGMGLRQLCDWACFVNKTHDQCFWEDELLPLFKKMGLLKFVMTLTYTCIRHLDIQTPEWFVAGKAELADQIFDKVMLVGNFGKKDRSRPKRFCFISANGERLSFTRKILKMFMSVNRTNSKMYPFLKKLPILHPFVTLWRIIKYLYLSAIGKKSSLKQRIAYADERATAFETFEIYK